MTTPNTPVLEGALSAQILFKLGEIGTDIAVIKEQLKDLPDHEKRLRKLEDSRSKLYGGVLALSAFISGGGTWVGIALSRH